MWFRRFPGRFLPLTGLQMSTSNRRVMENPSIVQLPKSETRFIRPYQLNYTDHLGRQRSYEAIQVHNAVSVVIYSVTRKRLLLVRQLRPVILASLALENSGKDTVHKLDAKDFEAIEPENAVTYELCSGIVDKPMSLRNIILAEIEEECGYKVPDRYLREITSLRGSVGVHGSLLTIFYCEVVDAMRVSEGGGLAAEHENISVFELEPSEIRNLIYDASKAKPPSLVIGLVWFLYDRETFLKEWNYVSPTDN